MKLKHLFEYNLKTQDFPNTKQYEYIETENYIFLKLDKRQNYILSTLYEQEFNDYINNMVIPSKINKDTLIDFFDNNHEYFTRLKKNTDDESFNFNNLKKIFNKNYMGYSDWDLCTSEIDLDYEMKHVLFHNVRDSYPKDVIEQVSSFIIIPSTEYERTNTIESEKEKLSTSR